MRIYMTGAHSVGKTTIVNHIAEEYDINRINEVAREVLRDYNMGLNEIRGDLQTCKKFQRTVLKRQIEKEKNTEEPFISDRGIDIFSYIAMYTHDLQNILKEEWTQDYIKSYHENNTVVIFVRPVPELIQEDGVRVDLTMENINRIDGMIKFILERYDIDYHSLETKHLGERVRFVRGILNQTSLSQEPSSTLSDF